MPRFTIAILFAFLLAGCQCNPAESLGYDLTAHGHSTQPPPPPPVGPPSIR